MQKCSTAISHPKTMAENERASDVLGREGDFDALQRSEESAELLAEKSMVAEQEAMLLQQKASEAETEVQRIKLSVIKTEEERLHMEKRVGETELIVHRMVEEAERRQQEAERLRLEVAQAREAEKEAKTKLIDFLNISVSETVKTSPSASQPPKTNGFHHQPAAQRKKSL